MVIRSFHTNETCPEPNADLLTNLSSSYFTSCLCSTLPRKSCSQKVLLSLQRFKYLMISRLQVSGY